MKPRCGKCSVAIGWTRYIRLAEAGKPIVCWPCMWSWWLRRVNA